VCAALMYIRKHISEPDAASSIWKDLDYLFLDDEINDKRNTTHFDTSLLTENVSSSIIQLFIVITVILVVFLLCKCNQFLDRFRDNLSNRYKNATDHAQQSVVHYNDSFKFKHYFSGLTFSRLRRRFLTCCCYKRKQSYYSRRVCRQIERHQFNKYYDRKKQTKKFNSRRESILHRRESIAAISVHRNRMYSSLRQHNKYSTNATQSLRLKSGSKSTRPSIV
jgi:hypothetical protein